MSAGANTPKIARQGWIIAVIGALIAAIGGLVLGLFLAGVFPEWGQETAGVPDLAPATGRPIGQAGRPDARTIASAPVADTARPADPVADEALRALMARRAEDEARLAERARLASESPLTPGVREIAEMVRRQEESAPDPVALGPGIAEPDPGTGSDTGATATDAAEPTLPHYVLARGSVIPAVLESAIDSALPGLVRARVSEDVYDSATGTHVLIPRGAALVGTYRQAGRAGQQRLFVAWTDLRMPDGMALAVDEFASLGADGATGIRGRRSTGFLKALGGAVLFDLAGNATQILTGEGSSQENQGDLGSLIATATGSATSRVADQYLGQLLSGGARFRVRAGAIMNVIVEEDIELPAAGGRP